MRRKAYLLLELLIAFSILALCAVPLIRNPMHSARSEMESFERMELEREAELAYASILEQMLCNTIAWKSLLAEKLPKEPSLEERIVIEVPGVFKREYKKEIYLWTKASKQGFKEEQLRLVAMKLVFRPMGKKKTESIAFNYRFFLSASTPLK